MTTLAPILRQTIQSRLERFGYRLVRIPAAARKAAQTTSSEEYWTRVNVTNHKRFTSAEESLNYFEWRNLLYSGYIELMPVAGHDGKAILDYGCGPGHDVVGFANFSKPARLIGMDVSTTSLAEARARVALHSHTVEFIRISEDDTRLPLEDASIDLIHSSGVLHHTPHPLAILKEFRRIVRPDGSAQIMIYNHDLIFVHLGVLYTKMILNGEFPGLSLEEAFQRSTDGPDCPISRCYRPPEWITLCHEAGFDAELRGVGISTWADAAPPVAIRRHNEPSSPARESPLSLQSPVR